MKKLLIILLIVIFGFCLTWTILDLTSKENVVYTAEEMEEYVNEYKTLYEQSLAQLEDLSKDNQDLISSNTNKDMTIQELTSTINQLNLTINSLNADIDSLQESNFVKSNELIVLQQEYTKFINNEYANLVQICEDKGYCVVTYKARDLDCFYGVELVQVGGYVTTTSFDCIYQDTNHVCAIGSTLVYLNDEVIEDLSTYQINESVSFEIWKGNSMPAEVV